MPAKVRAPAPDALPRERLETRLADAWRYRLGLVVAPAGSGKTTLLARFAAESGVPAAWYRAETWDADERSLLRHLEAAVRAALPGIDGGWTQVEDAAAALEAWPAGRALLVVDDLHTLEGTPAEAALGRLIDYAPAWLAILAGSRVAPDLNLPRLRVSGELLEIGADDLRFRAWEVERLFRDVYREPVAPGDLAVLARRTEGWAAGLQLFHLATRGKPAEERRRILTGAAASGRLVREYLARNVLAELPAELRSFLVETSVLGRLSGELCDRLRERTGSSSLLDELVRRQIFTVALDEAEGTYRYHEVLRSHLDRILVDEVGEVEARARHARAGSLLEAAGAHAEALAAFCRAEDWPAVQNLLGGQGERLAEGSADWLDVLPPAIARHDPWLTLASARRARAEGRWSTALEAYSRAEAAFGASATGLVCRRERQALASWLDPVAIPPADWTGLLRSGLVREPLGGARAAARLEDGHGQLVEGVLKLAAGHVVEARRTLARAGDDVDLAPGLTAAAWLAEGVAALLAGDRAGASRLEAGIEAAERAGQPWLARLGRTASRLDDGSGGAEDASSAASGLADPSDPWGSALVGLLEAWDAGAAGDGVDGPSEPADRRTAAAEQAAAGLRRLGAGVLESWARGLTALALAETGAAEARDAALAAESFARATGTPGARLLAYRALSAADPARAADYELLAETVRGETGLADPPSPVAVEAAQSRADDSGDDAVSWRVRTFGGFVVEADGRRLSLDGVKPRARTLLRYLASHAGSAVHREVIGTALWPEADPQTGARSLQVAISALRGLFGEAVGSEGAGLVARDGDAYRLAIEADAIDIGRFEAAIAEGRAARARGETGITPYAIALALHSGELLPEEGPADWVVERREHYRAMAVEAARAVAEGALLEGDLVRAVSACRTGLELDRYHDPLWRILIDAQDRAGDPGSAGRDRREYAAVLADLGLPEPAGVSL